MSKKLNVRNLKRKKLPYGKFNYVVLLRRSHWRTNHSAANSAMIDSMRSILRDTCQGAYRLDWIDSRQGRRVYTHLYLMNPMDVAMVKLTHHDKLHKIFKVVVEPSPS